MKLDRRPSALVVVDAGSAVVAEAVVAVDSAADAVVVVVDAAAAVETVAVAAVAVDVIAARAGKSPGKDQRQTFGFAFFLRLGELQESISLRLEGTKSKDHVLTFATLVRRTVHSSNALWG
jgi:MinD-like ATPase involved in chromosome partitioning or flagellar assembly